MLIWTNMHKNIWHECDTSFILTDSLKWKARLPLQQLLCWMFWMSHIHFSVLYSNTDKDKDMVLFHICLVPFWFCSNDCWCNITIIIRIIILHGILDNCTWPPWRNSSRPGTPERIHFCSQCSSFGESSSYCDSMESRSLRAASNWSSGWISASPNLLNIVLDWDEL